MAALGRSLRLRVLASGALLFLCQGFGMSLITYLYAIDDASSPFVSLEAATGLSATEYALLVGYINGGAGLLSGLTIGGAGVRPGVRIFLCSAGARRSRTTVGTTALRGSILATTTGWRVVVVVWCGRGRTEGKTHSDLPRHRSAAS